MFLYLLTSCWARKLPEWFDNYHMALTLTIPGRGVAIPISVVQAERYEYNSLLKVEFYQGLQQEFTSNFLGKVKYVFRNGKRVCLQDLTPQDPPGNAATFLPDLYDYNFAGVELVEGIWADKYTQNVPHVSAAGDSSGMFDRISFYYDPVTNKPLKWSMHARDQVFSSHTDEYVVTYHEYKRSTYPVNVPDICIKNPTKAVLNLQLHAFFKRFSVDAKLTSPNIHDNLRTVQNLNAQHNLTEFRLNHFSHMKETDIIQRSTGYRFSQKRNVKPTLIPAIRRTPHSFDWREVDEVVPPIKDQDMCGSCWAFSMISAMESAHGLLTGKLTVLPEQAIIDCVWSDANNACDGGQPDDAAESIIQRFNGNVPSEEAYGTYLSIDGKCSDRIHDISGARLLSWLVVPPRDDVQVTQALLTQPLSVAIAVTREMIWYGKGILDVPACKVTNEDLNHAVNLIGYGTKEKDFWLLRNSWSRHWGEDGYMKIVRGENDCGVTLQAQYPIVGALIDDVIV